MDARMFGLETPLMTALQHLLDVPDSEAGDKASAAGSGPMRTYVRDSRAMAATPADVKELPGAYSFVVDMPGLGTSDIKVQVEDERVLVISGERRREEREAGSECGFWAVECGGGGGAPPSTLAEFTLNGAGGNDFYDVCSSWRARGGSDCSPAASIVVGVRQAGGGVVVLDM